MHKLLMIITLNILFSASFATELVTGDSTVTEAMYIDSLLKMPPQDRKKYLLSAQSAGRLVDELYKSQKLIAAAKALGLDEDPRTLAEMKFMQNKVLIQSLFRKLRADIKRPDFELLAKEYYLTHAEEFSEQPQVQIRYVWTTIPNCAEREATFKRMTEKLAVAKKQQSFVALAESYEKSSRSDPEGSMLNWVVKGKLPKSLDEAAFALTKPGELSEVIESDNRLYIIRLEDSKPAGSKSFEQVKYALMMRLSDAYLGDEVARLRSKIVDPSNATANQQAIETAYENAKKKFSINP